MAKIMLVEDDSSLASAIKDHFAKNDIEVVIAGDSNEMRQMMDSSIEMILLDIYLPRPNNGLDALKILKDDIYTKNIPVAMLTNISDPSVEIKSKELGAIDYLIKSDNSLEELLSRVKEILELKYQNDLLVKKTRKPKK